MQGWLLEEMSKFTKIGVATPKYQIQNNFQKKKFDFKNQPQKAPQTFSPHKQKSTETSWLKNPVSYNWHFSNYNTENTKNWVHKQNTNLKCSITFKISILVK